MPAGWAAAAVAAGTVVSGYMQSEAMKSAAQTQADAAARAQGQVLEAGRQGAEKFQPYVDKGTVALNQMTSNPYFTQQFTNKDLNSYLAPGYDFRLQQGQKANLMGTNASGGAVSGNALRALQDYTQNTASTEYANAFNQFQAQRSNIYSNLRDIANFGLTGATGQANALIGAGTNVASITNAAGNAQAASQIAQGNIYGNTAQGLSNAGAFYAMNNMNKPNYDGWQTSGSNQYFGSNSNGLGAGQGYTGMNTELGLA